MNVHYHRMFVPLIRKFMVSKVLGASVHICQFLSLHLNATVLEKKEQMDVFNQKQDRLFSSFVPDVIDTFTESLVQEKTYKWESHKRERTCNLKENPSDIDEINTLLSSEQVDQAVLDRYASELLTISIGSVKYFLLKCSERRVCPSKNVLHSIANVCAQCGDKESVQAVRKLSLSESAHECKRHAGYMHYEAVAIWVNGNVELALEIFLQVYDKNPPVRRNIRFMLKIPVMDAVFNQSEATLVLIRKFAFKLIDMHKDYAFLGHLWEGCFKSKWHSDNQIAQDLLRDNKGLLRELQSRIPFMVCVALQSHNVCVVQKLFDIVLQYDLVPERSIVLRMLFDYACSRGDMKACTAIMKSLGDLNVTLTEAQLERFLYVFCQQKCSKHLVQAPRFYMKF